MAKIKRKIVTGFTTIQNDFLRDRTLGFTERGLLVTMLSLPDNWDFSAVGLASIVPDGKAKTYACLKKLETAGYLKRSRIYENGKVVDWLYEFCDVPVFLEEKNLLTENREVGQNLFTDFVEVENVEQENLKIENREDNKYTKKESTKKSNTITNQSINPKGGLPPTDRLIDDTVIDDIKDQIEYKVLEHDFDTELLNMVVSCLAELYAVSKPQKFNDRSYSAEFVRNRSLSINSDHIRYVFECFQNQREKVRNVKKYLQTAIFNAPDTIGAYYENAVRADGFL